MSRSHRGRVLGEALTRALPTPAGAVQLETFVPWTLVKRGSKKQIITPLDAPQEFGVEIQQGKRVRDTTRDTTLMRALGLAHYWQRLLDEQRVVSVIEIAKAEGIDVTHVRRLLRLALLAPEIVEKLISAPGGTLESVMRRTWPVVWHAQIYATVSMR
ncbi:hypothetical protein ACPEAN_14780 [Ralstonia solanacearum]|uniref:hypothetical protein n=1 Tax=Ralstonia solanacearum TaxID=305 RepID=UPI003CC544B5